MFVDRIYEDEWSGVYCKDIEYECSDFEQVELAIRKLNGKNKTMVILSSTKDHKTLTIGGGNDGRYIAYLSINTDDKFYNLINNDKNSFGQCDIVAGGQSGAYPSKQCLTINMVMDACKIFSLYGKKNPDAIWELQK